MRPIEVLIVEDNTKITRTHQAFVDKIDGFEVTGIANSIDEARLLVSTLEPDLILLDVYFPESSGIEFLKELRGADRNVDVILITAAREVGMLHTALQGGAFDYMIKPVFFDRFEESLTNYRDYRKKLAAARELSQDDADKYFRRSAALPHAGAGEMPKGIDAVTLESIITVFRQEKSAKLSATEVGNQIGVSRTTARKYLEYLISTGTLTIFLDYGTKGRPERKYFLAN